MTLHKECSRDVATGGIWVYISPKSVQLDFLWGKNDVKKEIEREYLVLYLPKKFYTPQHKFLATPLECSTRRGYRDAKLQIAIIWSRACSSQSGFTASTKQRLGPPRRKVIRRLNETISIRIRRDPFVFRLFF